MNISPAGVTKDIFEPLPATDGYIAIDDTCVKRGGFHLDTQAGSKNHSKGFGIQVERLIIIRYISTNKEVAAGNLLVCICRL